MYCIQCTYPTNHARYLARCTRVSNNRTFTERTDANTVTRIVDILSSTFQRIILINPVDLQVETANAELKLDEVAEELKESERNVEEMNGNTKRV
jgi:hypothetical protein